MIQPMHVLLCLSILVFIAFWAGVLALVYLGLQRLSRRR